MHACRSTLEDPTAPFGAPYEPTEDADVGTSIDLIYDARAQTLMVDASAAPEPPIVPRGGAIAFSELASGARAVLVGLANVGEWAPATQWFTYSDGQADPTSGALMLGHPRFGATVSGLEALGLYLVWGGDVGEAPAADAVLGNAGEILDTTGSRGLVASSGTIPPPVAFHTATVLGNGDVLIAGGLPINPTMGAVFNEANGDPIFILRAQAGGSVAYAPVEDSAYAPTMLHTATAIPGRGVMIVGGAHGTADRLAPVSSVGLVANDRYSSQAELSVARWGHTATLLPGKRLLVIGGFGANPPTGEPPTLRALSLAEVLFFDAPALRTIPDGTCESDLVDDLDAGRDGGPPPIDGGPPPVDAGPVDAGPDSGI